MAEASVEIPVDLLNPVQGKKVRSRKALKPKNSSVNEANIVAGKITKPTSSPLSVSVEDVGKENQETLFSGKKIKVSTKTKTSQKSFEKELEEMKGKFEQMRLEKEKTEELLKDRDEMLKQKEEELEIRGKEQEKLQLELKKLQRLKEFKPTMSLPLVQSLREKEQEKKEKKKNKKGEMKIKKPSPAYVLWSKEQWVELKNENPDAEFKEIASMIAAKWKNLSAEEKKPYEEKYQADKEAYLQIVGKEKRENEAMKLLEEEQKQKTAMELLEQYLQFQQEAVKDTKKKAKKERDPLKPKQPLSAFFVFSKDRREALFAEGKSAVEVAKFAGEEWKNMSEEMRRPYEEIAKEQKEEYLREMEAYNQMKDEEAAIHQKEEEEQLKIHKQEALQLLKKKEKTENIIKKTKETRQKKKGAKNVDPNKPKKPASSFILFSKEARKNLLEERPGINNSTVNAMISVKWKELSDDKKKVWNEAAAESMASYKKELEEYNKSLEAHQQ